MAFMGETIGYVRTPFTAEAGTPIQAAYAEDTEAVVELDPRYAGGLEDLDGFERIWLICWLDRARTAQLTVVPYLDDKPHGVFATRAPSRPNPIGLSCVRLLSVEGNVLRVAGVDMLDGTPVLDIKPYVPECDAFPDVRYGWFQQVRQSQEQRTRADERFVAPNEEQES